jgi:hypothetical protein
VSHPYPAYYSIKRRIEALPFGGGLLAPDRRVANSVCTNARANLQIRFSRQRLLDGRYLLTRVR